MNIKKYLTAAGVPEHLHTEALASLADAKRASENLLLHKLKVRYFNAKKISKLLPWEVERLIDVEPTLLDLDIAPVINVTAHGDNGPWEDTPEGGRPVSNYWLNPDPESDEYKFAVSKNYWCKGEHPRSQKSRKAWYRRNGGEGKAFRLGPVVDPARGLEIWRGKDVIAWRASGAWIIIVSRKIIGPLRLQTRIGFEVSNIYSGDYSPQMWFPLPQFDLRAPATNSTLPTFSKLDMQLKQWEPSIPTVQGTYTKWPAASGQL